MPAPNTGEHAMSCEANKQLMQENFAESVWQGQSLSAPLADNVVGSRL